MDTNEAIDMAADVALGADAEEVTESTPETTEQEAQDAEEQLETETVETETDDDSDDGDLAARLAELTHEEVVQTKAGKGLTAEIQRLREENRKLKAARSTETEVDDDMISGHDDPLAELEDDDFVEVRHVKSMIDKAVESRLAPVQERLSESAKATRQQIMETGLAALKADKTVPKGVNPSKIVKDAISTLGESRPVLLKELLSEPDPVRAVWEYATARMPEARNAVAKARKTTAEVEAERLARGRSPETGDEPGIIDDLVAGLNTPLE